MATNDTSLSPDDSLHFLLKRDAVSLRGVLMLPTEHEENKSLLFHHKIPDTFSAAANGRDTLHGQKIGIE